MLAAWFIAKLLSNGIRLVCLDFDQTLISAHTSGRWRGSAEQLAPYIRQFFKSFIPMAIKAGLKVAITTFSGQSDLIKVFLKIHFNQEIADAIPIEGWYSRNKNKHITNIMTCDEFKKRKFTFSQVMLIDDDNKNVVAARDASIPAIHLDPLNPHEFLVEYLLT